MAINEPGWRSIKRRSVFAHDEVPLEMFTPVGQQVLKSMVKRAAREGARQIDSRFLLAALCEADVLWPKAMLDACREVRNMNMGSGVMEPRSKVTFERVLLSEDVREVLEYAAEFAVENGDGLVAGDDILLALSVRPGEVAADAAAVMRNVTGRHEPWRDVQMSFVRVRRVADGNRPTSNKQRSGPQKVDLMRYFRSSHLTEPRLRRISEACAVLAGLVSDELIDDCDPVQFGLGLQKLIEAKDCFVRAALPREG